MVVAVAGPNGAGKTTFYYSHLQPAGLRFVNADVIARELHVSAYEGARIAQSIREELVRQRESFVFETVFSDPVGDKLSFLSRAAGAGYAVVLCYIGIGSFERSEERVSMRVSQGGHDVPTDKLMNRFPRTLANLQRAIGELPHVRIYDNDDLRSPYRLAGVFENARLVEEYPPIPKWLHGIQGSM
ncbi:MAG: zeta toxin family protein [Acidobacteriaceae bacterium]